MFERLVHVLKLSRCQNWQQYPPVCYAIEKANLMDLPRLYFIIQCGIQINYYN